MCRMSLLMVLVTLAIISNAKGIYRILDREYVHEMVFRVLFYVKADRSYNLCCFQLLTTKSWVAIWMKVIELFLHSKAQLPYQTSIIETVTILSKNATRLPCPMATEYLQCKMVVSAWVLQRLSRITRNMENQLIALVVREDHQRTMSTKLIQVTKINYHYITLSILRKSIN